eukprot:6112229-Lingulodinium_polyedra.AAC.1
MVMFKPFVQDMHTSAKGRCRDAIPDSSKINDFGRWVITSNVAYSAFARIPRVRSQSSGEGRRPSRPSISSSEETVLQLAMFGDHAALQVGVVARVWGYAGVDGRVAS